MDETARNRLTRIAEAGLETLQDFTGNSRVLISGDADSDALLDSRLARLIEVWPALADDVRSEILRLAGLRSYDVDDFKDMAETDALDRFRDSDGTGSNERDLKADV